MIRDILKVVYVFCLVFLCSSAAYAQEHISDAASKGDLAGAIARSTVHIEYKWSDWTTNNLSTNQIAEYMALFKATVENGGMKVVDSKELPTVTTTLDLMGGFTFLKGGKTESHVTYKVIFLCTGTDGKQIFKKEYRGEVKGGDARIESGGMVFMGCNVKLEDVKQAITKQLESEPLK